MRERAKYEREGFLSMRQRAKHETELSIREGWAKHETESQA